MTADGDLDSASGPVGPSRGWWKDLPATVPRGYLDLISAEEDASQIMHYQLMVIPGLLQTRRYAAAITPATTLKTLTHEDVMTLVDVRMMRQRAAFDPARRRRLTMLMDEACLHRMVGDEATMHEQLARLLELSGHPMHKIVVAPLRSPPHPGVLGPFMMLRYDDGRDDVLCFEGQTGNVLIRDDPSLVGRYGGIADRLVAGEPDGSVTTTLIKQAMERLGGPPG